MPTADNLATAIFTKGALRCSICDSVLRPKHWKKSCCKAAYRRHCKQVDTAYRQTNDVGK